MALRSTLSPIPGSPARPPERPSPRWLPVLVRRDATAAAPGKVSPRASMILVLAVCGLFWAGVAALAFSLF